MQFFNSEVSSNLYDEIIIHAYCFFLFAFGDITCMFGTIDSSCKFNNMWKAIKRTTILRNLVFGFLHEKVGRAWS